MPNPISNLAEIYHANLLKVKKKTIKKDECCECDNSGVKLYFLGGDGGKKPYCSSCVSKFDLDPDALEVAYDPKPTKSLPNLSLEPAHGQ